MLTLVLTRCKGVQDLHKKLINKYNFRNLTDHIDYYSSRQIKVRVFLNYLKK